MSKSKLMKVILVGVLSLMLVFVATQVFADDDDGFTDLTGSVTSNNTTDNNATTDNTTNNTTLNLTTDNTTNNTTNNTVNNATVNNATVNTTYNTSNNLSSSYNNSNLPSTGIGETTSVMFIIIALVISAIFAYKKVSYYKNI